MNNNLESLREFVCSIQLVSQHARLAPMKKWSLSIVYTRKLLDNYITGSYKASNVTTFPCMFVLQYSTLGNLESFFYLFFFSQFEPYGEWFIFVKYVYWLQYSLRSFEYKHKLIIHCYLQQLWSLMICLHVIVVQDTGNKLQRLPSVSYFVPTPRTKKIVCVAN